MWLALCRLVLNWAIPTCPALHCAKHFTRIVPFKHPGPHDQGNFISPFHKSGTWGTKGWNDFTGVIQWWHIVSGPILHQSDPLLEPVKELGFVETEIQNKIILALRIKRGGPRKVRITVYDIMIGENEDTKRERKRPNAIPRPQGH